MARIIDKVNIKGQEYRIHDSSAADRVEVNTKFAEIEARIDASAHVVDASINYIINKFDNIMTEEEYEEIETPENKLYFIFED